MSNRLWSFATLATALAFGAVGCGGDDDDAESNGGRGGTGSMTQTLCAKYGGADNVDMVVKTNVLGAISADCRINAFFASLSTDAMTRLADCLSIQVQGLFECEGVTYAGSEASNGLECRSMTEAHQNLGISKGDFDALIEDVVAGLSEAGVEEADINAAAPALLGMQGQIVEDPSELDPTQTMCVGDAAP